MTPEEEHWRKVALYLADCHAANLEGLPKSTSKYQRERMKEICRKSLYMLANSLPEGVRQSDMLSVQERLRRNIA